VRPIAEPTQILEIGGAHVQAVRPVFDSVVRRRAHGYPQEIVMWEKSQRINSHAPMTRAAQMMQSTTTSNIVMWINPFWRFVTACPLSGYLLLSSQPRWPHELRSTLGRACGGCGLAS